MKSSQHKMTSNLLLILVLIINTSTKNLTAQDSQKPNINGFDTPFDFKNTETFCNRDWMASELVMDSLKKVILKLDNKLKRLPQDSIISDTSSLVLLYSYEYIVRNDPWGESSHQWCIDADKYRTHTSLQKSEKGIKNEIISVDNKYVVVTDTYYYLGNSEIWTTHRKYYMRQE